MYRVRDQKQLSTVIIPFFEKYPLQGQKYLNFNDFRTVINMMNQKLHLTPEGQEKIKVIKESMNRGRK